MIASLVASVFLEWNRAAPRSLPRRRQFATASRTLLENTKIMPPSGRASTVSISCSVMSSRAEGESRRRQKSSGRSIESSIFSGSRRPRDDSACSFMRGVTEPESSMMGTRGRWTRRAPSWPYSGRNEAKSVMPWNSSMTKREIGYFWARRKSTQRGELSVSGQRYTEWM